VQIFLLFAYLKVYFLSVFKAGFSLCTVSTGGKVENMRVVVTGGAGFIGSHLAEELAKRGSHVIIIDNLSSGKMVNIERLSKISNVEFVKGSITDLPLLEGLFSDVDYVFHQAAMPSAIRSIEEPLTSHEVNITGTLNMLWASRNKKVKKVIYTSSSAIYGDTPALPKREDMMPAPLSPYAVSKLAGEYYCLIFQELYDLPTACLRYFNVYGPRQDPNSQYAAVIPRFIIGILQGDPPIIFGDGEQTRDFIFVKDVAETTILIAKSSASGIFNIGGGESITINRLAKTIIEAMGRDMKPVYQEQRAGDVRHSLADISKIRRLGYNPKYSVDDGLKETIRWFSEMNQG
jgi:UDP-glucose 4-epimerase